jgi:hypothetical protein
VIMGKGRKKPPFPYDKRPALVVPQKPKKEKSPLSASVLASWKRRGWASICRWMSLRLEGR